MAGLSQEGQQQRGEASRLSLKLGQLETRLAAGSDTESLASARSNMMSSRKAAAETVRSLSDVVAVEVPPGAAASADVAAASPKVALHSPLPTPALAGGGITLSFDKLYAELVVHRPCFGEVRDHTSWASLTPDYFRGGAETHWCPAQAKKRILLAEVTGVIEAGTMYALMGPSGAGKTTLLVRVAASLCVQCLFLLCRLVGTGGLVSLAAAAARDLSMLCCDLSFTLHAGCYQQA